MLTNLTLSCSRWLPISQKWAISSQTWLDSLAFFQDLQREPVCLIEWWPTDSQEQAQWGGTSTAELWTLFFSTKNCSSVLKSSGTQESLILPLWEKLEGLWGCWRMIVSASSWNCSISSCLMWTFSTASSRRGPLTQSLFKESCSSSQTASKRSGKLMCMLYCWILLILCSSLWCFNNLRFLVILPAN